MEVLIMQQVKTVSIKGKQYVTVNERVRLVHEERETFEMIESKPMQVGDMWIWQAMILVDGKRFIGTAEVKLDAPKNTADGTNPFACAETSAVGRALGFAGLGALESICSADEVVRALAEQEAPPVRKTPIGNHEPSTVTESQRTAILNLCRLVGMDTPDLSEWSQQRAAEAIRDLQGRMKERSNGKQPVR
jgi:hypothetical protein